MKKSVNLITIFLLCNFYSYSQIDNGSFTSFTFTNGTDCDDNVGPGLTMAASPFVACSGYNGWFASHGSPEVFVSGGDNCATMWSGRWTTDATPRGEGIEAYCFFSRDKVYHLTLRMKCSGYDNSGSTTIDNFINDVYIKLGNNVPILTVVSYNPVSSYYSIPSVSGTQTIVQYTNFSGTSWQNVDIYFTPNDDYNTLWIYPQHSNGPSDVSVLFVDDVSIEDCLPNVTYSNTSSLPNLTLRSDFISATTNTQVLSGQDVTFTAGNSITLSPGFYANSGSDFLAYIGGCEQMDCTSPFLSPVYYNNGLKSLNFEIKLDNDLKIFPNPTSGSFIIQAGQLITNSTIEVYNVLGNMVYKKQVDKFENEQIDISNFDNGLYYIRIKGNEGMVNETRKIIKE